jgi:hypothetical protein
MMDDAENMQQLHCSHKLSDMKPILMHRNKNVSQNHVIDLKVPDLVAKCFADSVA